jgi:hypothetical protein
MTTAGRRGCVCPEDKDELDWRWCGMALVAGRMETEMPGLGASAADEQLGTRLVSQAIRRAQEGDREALGFLYSRYADSVYGYVRSIVHDAQEAEDVTQQVFAKLIHVIGKYEEREVPFFTWILRVARNLAFDHLRRQRTIPCWGSRRSDASITSDVMHQSL